MLSIGLVSTGQESYYLDLAREDYYTESGEPEGQWLGGAVPEFGLTGPVRKHQLSRLLQGFAPTGAPLVRNAGSASRRAGLDLTFSAPKSVSVLWSQARSEATRRAIQEAHAAAVAAAVQYLESEASFVRFGVDGVHRQGARLVVATFEHSSARLAGADDAAPDPHLHTHALVVNAGVTEDGSTATLDSREFYRHKMSAGVLYRAELFRQIQQRLGLAAARGERFCELVDIPTALTKEFSKRRLAIESYLEERGISGAHHSDSAALKTRTVKPKVDREAFFKEWQRVGAEHGLVVDEEFLQKAARSTQAKVCRPPEQLLEDAATSAIRRVTEQHSHFARRDLVRAVAEELEDKALGAAAALQVVDRVLESPEVRRVGEALGEPRFSTEEMLRMERAMLREAAGLTRRLDSVQPRTLVSVLRARPTITEEQRDALHHLTERSALAVVRGLAGTGKTYLLEAAREAWEIEGRTVYGVALAATAAKRLQEGSGIKSETLHRLLWRLEGGELELSANSVVVVDEAAMVGTRQLAALVRTVSAAGGKLVLVGDDRQLQAIEAGAPFASLAKRFGAAELNDIRRQRREWARDAVVEFSRGEAHRALRRYRERGLVHVAETRREAIQKLARDFEAAVQASGFAETAALTGTRAEAKKLNREIQMRRRARGELGDRLLLGEEAFHVGDRVLFRKNSRRLGILNGDRGEVVRVSGSSVTVRFDSGDRVSFSAHEHELVAPHLGYASTTHAMQGATVERCLVLCGGSMEDREAAYVQASRAREETRLYVDRASAGEEFADMIRSMERSRAKSLAADLEDGAGLGSTAGGQELVRA